MAENESLFDLNIIVYADGPYQIFVAPYICFALLANPRAHVEVVVDNIKYFSNKYSESLQVLEQNFPNQYCIVEDKNSDKDVLPNTRRFLHVPVQSSRWVYFGDIDLFLCDDILEIHLNLIEKNNIIFSNMIRDPNASKPRLTGLHFVKYKDYYPLPPLDDLNLRVENDEHVLYCIMKRHNLMIPASFRIRPDLGIHASLSRDPTGRYSLTSGLERTIKNSIKWGGILEYQVQFDTLKNTSQFQAVYGTFDIKIKMVLLIIDAIANQTFSDLKDFSMKYVVDKDLLFDRYPFQRKEIVLSEVGKLIQQRSFSKAKDLCRSAHGSWPDCYTIQAYLCLVYLLTGETSQFNALFTRLQLNSAFVESIQSTAHLAPLKSYLDGDAERLERPPIFSVLELSLVRARRRIWMKAVEIWHQLF